MEHQHASGGIVIREKDGNPEVLLIKDSYGHWIWPKGHIEEGETPEIAAIREISEETGLKTLSILEMLGEQEYYFTLKGKEIFKTVYIFIVRGAAEDDLKIQTEEVQSAAWFSHEEAVEKIEYDGARSLLEKGIKVYLEKYRNGERGTGNRERGMENRERRTENRE